MPSWFGTPLPAAQKLIDASDSYIKEHPERGHAESPIETESVPTAEVFDMSGLNLVRKPGDGPQFESR
jgi:hypothetical protein